jgi:hypothetical protein
MTRVPGETLTRFAASGVGLWQIIFDSAKIDFVAYEPLFLYFRWPMNEP